MKCYICKKRFTAGKDGDGIPNGVGLVLKDGKTYNVCKDCLIKIGKGEIDIPEEMMAAAGKGEKA